MWKKIKNQPGGGYFNNRKVIIPILVLLLILVIGTTYALWQLTFTQSGTNVITTGCLKLTLTDDTDAINLTDATPTTDEEGRKLVPYTFTLQNTCTTESAYVINLETVSSGEKILADEYVKANLLKGTEEVFIDKLVETHQNEEKVITDASRAYMLTSGKLAGNESISYSLRLWMTEETEALDDVMNATWQGKITVTASYVPKEVTAGKELYSVIMNRASLDNTSSEFVTNESGINFGEAPSDTNGKGIYTVASTKDNEYPIHYFRGEVTNNNVHFANFCWKIVRTTETGGVKLIYNGTPNESGGCTSAGEATQIVTSQFNGYDNPSYHIGYMVPATEGSEPINRFNSRIKTTIDTWYQKNMIAYTSYLEDTVWCNDRSVYKTEDSSIYYGAYERNNDSYKPSMECSNANDRFTVSSENGNSNLTYPVALLTADEATLAGNGRKGYSSASYLNNNQDWWLMSPGYYWRGCTVYYVYRSGGLSDVTPLAEKGVRPAISLAPGIVLGNGDGSADFPYKISSLPNS